MTTGPGRMIPLAEIREVLAELMTGREHLSQEPYVRRDETGWLPLAELPPDEGLRLADFYASLASLPDPAPEPAIAEAIKAVFVQRGHFFLLGELAQLCEDRWPDPAGTGVPEGPGSWMPLCQWCGQRCEDKRARYCCGSHRQQAYKKRKRDG